MSQAIIYCRLSNPNQSMINNFHVSIENQLDTCRNYCSTNNFFVVGEVHEIKSARDMNYLYELKKIGESNSNLNLVIYNVTRFSRNILQGLQYIQAFSSKNITIHFVEENARSNQHLDLHRIRLGLSQSEYESDTISNRVKANNIILRNKGWKFGQAPYGKEVKMINGIRTFSNCNYENQIIKFIKAARIGTGTVMNLNKLLNSILPNNKEPIEFWDWGLGTQITRFDEPYTLSFGEIAELLNSYNICNRANIWTASSVNRVFKNHNKDIYQKFNSMNI